MQALLSLSSYVHTIDELSNPARPQNRSIAEMTLRHFTVSIVDVLASGRGHQTSEKEQRGPQANVFDLKFLRRLLTSWKSDWDGISDLNKFIEQLQVRSLPKSMYDMDMDLPPNLRSLPLIQKSGPTTTSPL
jgi:hypothetical protein